MSPSNMHPLVSLYTDIEPNTILNSLKPLFFFSKFRNFTRPWLSNSACQSVTFSRRENFFCAFPICEPLALWTSYSKRCGPKTASLWGLVPPGTMRETEPRLGWGAARLTRAGCWRLSDSRAAAQVCMGLCSVLPCLGAQQDHSCHLAQLWKAL